MQQTKRKWSVEQKLQILQQAETQGIEVTLRQYQLSDSLFYKWKRKFNQNGMAGLQPQYPKVDLEKRKMEQEIKRLKELVGELSLELRFKEDLLKKSQY